MDRVLHILKGNYLTDSRVQNEAEFLARKFSVCVYCVAAGQRRLSSPNNKIKGVSLTWFSSAGGVLNEIFVWLQVIAKGIRFAPKIVHAHDVQTLPAAFLIAKLARARFVYDSHELWSQAHHRRRSHIVLKVAEFAERRLASKADVIVTVSERIAIYLAGYFQHSAVHVVRNIPTYISDQRLPVQDRKMIRRALGVDGDQMLFIYQGLINKERGVFLILEALSSLKDFSFSFLFLGSGPDLEELKGRVCELKLDSYVLFKDPVPQSELGVLTQAADVGVHAINNTCLNHDFCLPNKLFEYLASGLPVIVTDLAEMAQFVRTQSVGLTFADNNADELAACMRQVMDERMLGVLRQGVSDSEPARNPEVEFNQLVAIYEDLLLSNRR